MKRFIEKPRSVVAVQFTGKNQKEIEEFVKTQGEGQKVVWEDSLLQTGRIVKDAEQWAFSKGYWVVESERNPGYLFVCTNELIKRQYREVMDSENPFYKDKE